MTALPEVVVGCNVASRYGCVVLWLVAVWSPLLYVDVGCCESMPVGVHCCLGRSVLPFVLLFDVVCGSVLLLVAPA